MIDRPTPLSQTGRRGFLRTAGAGTTALALSPLLHACSQKLERPNIVLIMADDLGAECLTCYGGNSYRTPALDALAAGGIRFTSCYAQPLCTPSRVQLMTGRYNHRNYTEFGALPPGEITVGQLLWQAGYATCVAGKWQLAGRVEGAAYRGEGTLPEAAGFDEHCLWQVSRHGNRYWDPIMQINGELHERIEGAYGPDLCCDYLIDFMQRSADRPFFAYYPMILPHDPFLPTPASGVAASERQQADRRFFGDMVEYVDTLVGRIVQALEAFGLLERTLLLFTGDNGTNRNIRSRRGDEIVTGGKGIANDAGMHVPLIASRPGTTPPGGICDDLIDFSDLLPTLAAAAGTPPPTDRVIDGRSFLAQLKGERGEPREWIFCHYDPRWGDRQPARFVRDHRWKLHADGAFYDLVNDPGEERPITPEHLSPLNRPVYERLRSVLASMD